MSKDREGAGLGIERQREDCLELAARLRLEVVGVYEDNDMSAYSGKPRKDYQRMLEDLRAERADVVLAWHTDRLHRSPAELEEYIDVCEPRGIQTQTVKAGHLDLTTATGRMIARQLGVQARYEVERMVERQRRARDQMVQQGRHLGGCRPFGWEADGVTPRSLVCPRCGRDGRGDFAVVTRCSECGASGGFDGWACGGCGVSDGRAVTCVCSACGVDGEVVRGSEFALIAEAAESVLSGASLRSIAADWSARGIVTSTGAQWIGQEVGEMLRRPRNAGIVKHRGREAGLGAWPAALEEPLWRSLVALLGDPGRRLSPGNERKYLGSGLYLCGVCKDGTTMRCATGSKGRGGVRVMSYCCRMSRHLTRQCGLLDEYVQMMIVERLSRPDAADLLAEREDPVDVRGAQRDMREARAVLDELAAAVGSGEMDMLEWRAASGAAKARLRAAEEMLSRAVRVNPVAGLVGADDVESAWRGLGLSRQRAVLGYLGRVTVLPARRGRLPGGVYFDPGSVEIVWR